MSKLATLTISCVQQPGFSSKTDSYTYLKEVVAEAATRGTNLLLLPELHATPYFPQIEDPGYFSLAEPIDGPTAQSLSELAQQFQMVIVGSIFERRAPGLYHNSALVFEKTGALAGIYRKMHIPDDPGYYEKYYFTPGDLGFRPINTSVGKLGVLVCWDQWFPEAARLMALQGAEILLYPTAIGWDLQDDNAEQQKQLDAWITVQRSHAIANGLPLAACNRWGFERHPAPYQSNQGSQFWGNSFIAGPQGEILVHANASQSTLLTQQLDRKNIEQVRQAWPFLRDRRVEWYQELTKLFIDQA
jgi:N-carbamoylputrescine amidase